MRLMRTSDGSVLHDMQERKRATAKIIKGCWIYDRNAKYPPPYFRK